MRLEPNLNNIPTVSLKAIGGIARFCNRGDLLVNNESMRHALRVIPDDAIPVDVVYQEGSLGWVVFYEKEGERFVYPWEEELAPWQLMNLPRYVADYDGVMHGCISVAKGWSRENGKDVKAFTYLFDVSPELPVSTFNSLFGQYEWLMRRGLAIDFRKTKPPAQHELRVYNSFANKDIARADTNAYSFFNRLNKAVNLMDNDVMTLVNHPSTDRLLVLPNSRERIRKGITSDTVNSSCLIMTK